MHKQWYSTIANNAYGWVAKSTALRASLDPQAIIMQDSQPYHRHENVRHEQYSFKILERRYDLLFRSPGSVLPPYRLGDIDILYLSSDPQVGDHRCRGE